MVSPGHPPTREWDISHSGHQPLEHPNSTHLNRSISATLLITVNQMNSAVITAAIITDITGISDFGDTL